MRRLPPTPGPRQASPTPNAGPLLFYKPASLFLGNRGRDSAEAVGGLCLNGQARKEAPLGLWTLQRI